MPIAGCVVSIKPSKAKEAEEKISLIPGVEIYGGELKEEGKIYYLVVVIEGDTFEDLEFIESQIKEIEGVLNVSVAEAYFLDEFEKIEKGETVPSNPFGRRRGETEIPTLPIEENDEKVH
ncbi:MAG: chaperone NapD [Desulfurobacteriaceae bacterium]